MKTIDPCTGTWLQFWMKASSWPFTRLRLRFLAALAAATLCVLSLHLGPPVLRISVSASFLRFGEKHGYRKLAETPSDAFTIVFVSDIESRYRNHSPLRCQYVLEYIRDLAQENLFFDGPYADARMDPKLVIHGGDNSHMLGCETLPFYLCRSVQDEWSTVWKTTFETANAVPLISSFGNHDWQSAAGTGTLSSAVWGSSAAPRLWRTDTINQRAQELVTKTYEESAKMGVEHQAFKPEGKIGQTFYRATFGGVQLATFNCAAFWESYDDRGVFDNEAMFNALAASLDREQTTVFFQHYPISDIPSSGIKEKTVSLIGEFPRAVHLSGHVHISRADDYGTFTDYVAPYPHFWVPYRAPGFYALLVSPSEGILQVKEVVIPGLPDGTPCNINDNCKRCDSGEDFWYSANEFRCGREPSLAPGASCFSVFWGCDACPDDADGNPNFYCPWYGFFLFFCSCTTNVRSWLSY